MKKSKKAGRTGGAQNRLKGIAPERERRGRAPTERMLRIHQILADGKYPNCFSLARDFEVSHKTITRDLEFMRDHLELPIEYDHARHGYFYSKQVDGFPGVSTVTESEMFALLVAHKAVAQYHGTPFHRPLQMAFEKMARQLDSRERYSLEDLGEALSFRPFAPEDTDLELFRTVTDARRARKVVQFSYRKPGEKIEMQRLVHPYHLTCSDNRWYLLGHDEDRGDIRTFALARIKSAEVTERQFVKPRDFNPAKYLRGSFAVMSGTGDYEVVIDFDAWATDQLRGRQWHVTQRVTELPGGASRMTMRLSGLEEVERWVLSWGTHAQVVSPRALVIRVGAVATAVAARHTVQ